MHIYIYIYRERERERAREKGRVGGSEGCKVGGAHRPATRGGPRRASGRRAAVRRLRRPLSRVIQPSGFALEGSEIGPIVVQNRNVRGLESAPLWYKPRRLSNP